MNLMKTLRFKLLIGFILVIVPLAAALFFQNYYAIKVVRDKVSQSTNSLLSLHISQIDDSLEKATQYLLRVNNSNIYSSDLIGLKLYPQGSTDYFFAKMRIFNYFQDELDSQEELDAFRPVNTFFAYTATYEELIATEIQYQSSRQINDMLHELLRNNEFVTSEWQVVTRGEKHYLFRVEEIIQGVYVGALTDADTIMLPLDKVDLGSSGQAMLLATDGTPLTSTPLDEGSLHDIGRKLSSNTPGYKVFTDTLNKTSYLLVGSKFQRAPIMLAIIIPEKDLLQKLPYFQRGAIAIPIGIFIVLIIFYYVLKEVLHKPMKALITGMRRMSQGDFDFRLHMGSSSEFSFLSETFNNMVSQISLLKSNIYEEIVKKQEAEFRHLQAQINPHFYLNSLNIIYSLSKLKKNDLVEKMSQHLAHYFRFITSADREFISLEEEIGHIRNYLEIQRLRFPNKVSYDISLPDEYGQCEVLPLMIQPFVENSIIHGMIKGREVFHISIEVRPIEGNPHYYETVISDNGVGFSPDILKRLKEGGPTDASSGKSLGIRNVQHRLKFKFGDAVHVQFRNRSGQEEVSAVRGAEVLLQIPYRWNEEDEVKHA